MEASYTRCRQALLTRANLGFLLHLAHDLRHLDRVPPSGRPHWGGWWAEDAPGPVFRLTMTICRARHS